jgi:hypothetical protein
MKWIFQLLYQDFANTLQSFLFLRYICIQIQNLAIMKLACDFIKTSSRKPFFRRRVKSDKVKVVKFFFQQYFWKCLNKRKI